MGVEGAGNGNYQNLPTAPVANGPSPATHVVLNESPVFHVNVGIDGGEMKQPLQQPIDQAWGDSEDTDFEYFKTPPGKIKLVQLILGVILICYPTTIWMSTVSLVCFLATDVWSCVYLFKINQKYQTSLPWHKMEYYYLVGAAIAFFLASFMSLFFNFLEFVLGLFAALAYAAGAYHARRSQGSYKFTGGT